MVSAWVMPSGDVADQCAPNQSTPNKPVSIEALRDLGVLHWTLDPTKMLVPDTATGKSRVDLLCEEQGYKNRDEVRCCPAHLDDYDAKINMFFQEHIHEDDEARLIKDGSGYFDVRSAADEWIRIRVVAGDLIVVPSGIYHRFTMDENNNTHAIRLFKEVPKWTPINRPCEENEHRKEYLAKFVPSPKRITILGEALGEKNDVFYVHYPELFDATLRAVIKSLNADNSDLVVLYYTGAHNPSTMASWCPDCVNADPRVVAGITKLRENRRVVFVYAPVERSSYLNNPGFLYRAHPFIQLTGGVPTLQVLRAKAEDEDDGPGVDVIGRFNGEVPENWSERL